MQEISAGFIELTDLAFSFSPLGESRPFFEGLNLAVARGESFGIVGPSGAGKSTLLKMMAGLLAPIEGDVRINGASIGKLNRRGQAAFRRQLGMTFQKSGLFDSLTCAENLDFALRELSPLKASERALRINRALEEVGLAGQGDLSISQMSGGMQKRLGIARALILSPAVVLYDDPTAGLDPVTSRSILQLIQTMKTKYEMTIVIVASDPTLIYSLADRVGFLHEGKFLEIASPQALRESSNPIVRQFVRGESTGPLTLWEDA